MNRREFLKGAGALGAAGLFACRDRHASPPPSDGWNAGAVAHLLPTADHRRFRIKASFREPLSRPPRLEVGDRSVAGRRSDGAGRFYGFHAEGLEPHTEYRLRLVSAGGDPLCEPWPLRTFPAPGSAPERLRLLAYTCAGGPDDLYNFGFFNAYLPVAHRQRLLARALSFRPDAVVANGDHVYWDMKSRFGWAMGRSPVAWWKAGLFDRDEPVLGTENEDVLVRAFDEQIAGLYGVRLRSHPVFFLQDDHDYGENDEASDALRTFPADPFMLDLVRSTQRLYYPEFLADELVPAAHVRSPGISESFGSLRWGTLFEGLLYDCRRFLTNARDPALADDQSHFVPPDVESWLLARSLRSPCVHLAHMPSTPVLWTAGKWLEWYPDAKRDGKSPLQIDEPKPYWAEGWNAQHQRLLTASAGAGRTPLFVSGDLHALAAGRILGSHGLAFDDNPVVSVLCGALGTGKLGWPSRFRGQIPVPSRTLRAEEIVAPIEENGFSLLDFDPDGLRVSLFRWRPDQGEDAIDRLEPFAVLEFPSPRGA